MECKPIFIQYFIYIPMTLAYLIAFSRIFAVLKMRQWSLADALSEPPNVVPPETVDPDAPQHLAAPAPIVQASKPFASSSRLIAFVGIVIISIIFISSGYHAIYALFNDASNLDNNFTDIGKYLMFSGTLFAPYVFNKVAAIGK
ncbi:hypothetical protein [Enterobacter sp.]|uniref:hypothetical protein n=1 Tax=Enterobacter sp. TaxID=42895 RepID=UPI0029012C39|nr:hypothetical protein [Enterobacter sp.]MDU2819125.1 hypothetical protein [Enterobacter sp.]